MIPVDGRDSFGFLHDDGHIPFLVGCEGGSITKVVPIPKWIDQIHPSWKSSHNATREKIKGHESQR